jgi:hypothetical protein
MTNANYDRVVAKSVKSHATPFFIPFSIENQTLVSQIVFNTSSAFGHVSVK